MLQPAAQVTCETRDKKDTEQGTKTLPSWPCSERWLVASATVRFLNSGWRMGRCTNTCRGRIRKLVPASAYGLSFWEAAGAAEWQE